MAAFDFEALRQPLAGDESCGPDLEAIEDQNYANFTVEIDGLLPESYFDENGKAFDRAAFDFKREYARIKPLLEQTRDIRLYVILARLCALDRDLDGFAQCMNTIAALLESDWAGVHPRSAGSAQSGRSTVISTLDASTVLFPLQYIPLCQSRRFGAIPYRAFMFTTGEAKARDGEATPGAAVILQALQDADKAETAAARASIDLAAQAVSRIKTLWIVNGSAADAPSLDRIKALLAKIQALFEQAQPREAAAAPAPDGDEAEEGEASAPAAAAAAAASPPGSVASSAAAQAALLAAIGYFRRREPSSPALPLLAQAHALHGKSFLEVMQALIPGKVSEAAFHIGGQQYFELPVESLAASAEPSAPEEAAAEAEAPPEKKFEAATRQQALALMDRIAAFFKASEPSSPVPWLIERARALAERDFLALLREVLPKASLCEIAHDD